MGKWQKGESGNPKGKSPGTKDWRTRLRKQLQEASPEVIDKVLSAARAGDLQAAKIIVDRVIPPLKSVSMPLTIKVPGYAKLTERAERIFQALTRGTITPDEASTVLGALATMLKVKELDELEGRIAALERGQTVKRS